MTFSEFVLAKVTFPKELKKIDKDLFIFKNFFSEEHVIGDIM
jgi:hypothetical protein